MAILMVQITNKYEAAFRGSRVRLKSIIKNELIYELNLQKTKERKKTKRNLDLAMKNFESFSFFVEQHQLGNIYNEFSLQHSSSDQHRITHGASVGEGDHG